MIDAVLGKFYKYIILGLMIFIFGYVFYANSLAGKLANAEKVKTKAVADAIKPYQDAIDQAQEEKAAIMQTWSAKIIEVEQNAIKKIQDANAAARSADLAASGLSKQLSEANKRLSTASRETSDEYCATLGNVFERSIEEYTKMARYADEHRVNEEKLSEAWPSD